MDDMLVLFFCDIIIDFLKVVRVRNIVSRMLSRFRGVNNASVVVW